MLWCDGIEKHGQSEHKMRRSGRITPQNTPHDHTLKSHDHTMKAINSILPRFFSAFRHIPAFTGQFKGLHV